MLIQYRKRPKFFKSIRMGDWIIECMKEDGKRQVTAPSQVLGFETWTSPKRIPYTLLMLESPNDGESYPLTLFRKLIRKYEPRLDTQSPRTRPIKNDEHADDILRLWTPSGRRSIRR